MDMRAIIIESTQRLRDNLQMEAAAAKGGGTNDENIMEPVKHSQRTLLALEKWDASKPLGGNPQFPFKYLDKKVL
ncbi:hypothetical protein ANCCEY_09951 [Ancylostoma ceylanicum]|uniref:Uncharacterized protein n=1 Tax=Ancylostoma ceylanicum TaxID=53326 RepID=A0A0D6LTI8_9BILA|nr:hypothetical protein ANCCEY_09951 [Ancylostoma ceylanicum]